MTLSFVLHVFNEELMLPHWLLHHRKLFDDGIIIDHHSTDRTREIAESSGFRVVTSALESFDAILNDCEVMEYEEQLPDGWKMAFNVTEFLFMPPNDLKNYLSVIKDEAVGFLPVCLVDKEPNLPLLDPLFKNRTWGFLDREGRRGLRFMHRAKNGAYRTGRHGTLLEYTEQHLPPILLHFTFSPWPECKERKLQIQKKVPRSDIEQNRGRHHIMTEAELEKKRLDFLQLSGNLLEVPLFKETYDRMLESAL